MKKNILISGALCLILLSGCSNSDSEIATMRGGKVKVDDFYQAAFLDPLLGNSLSGSRKQTNEQLLQDMIIKKVFLEEYGRLVSESMIEDAFKEQEEKYGGRESFQRALQASGISKKYFQEMIKENLAIELGLKEHMEIGDSELATAWGEFHPTVETQIIQVSEETKAKDILEQLQEDSSNFGEIAKKESEHEETALEKGKIKFDSLNETLPTEVKKAAFVMENNELSEVISAVNPFSNQTNYYIIKMINNDGKEDDMEKYLDELTEIAEQSLLNDNDFVFKAVGKELQNADVEIKDDRLNDILSDFIKYNDIEKSIEESAES